MLSSFGGGEGFRPLTRHAVDRERRKREPTLARMASSMGVAEVMVESCRPTFENPKAYRRNMRGKKKKKR